MSHRLSPLGGMNEASGRLPKPLGDAHDQAHVCQPGGLEVGQPVRRTTEFVRQCCPGELALVATLVECGMQLAEIPSQATS